MSWLKYRVATINLAAEFDLAWCNRTGDHIFPHLEVLDHYLTREQAADAAV